MVRIKIKDKQGYVIASIGIFELLVMAQAYGGAGSMFPDSSCNVYLNVEDEVDMLLTESEVLLERPDWLDNEALNGVTN